jgi:hypothetical protein
MPMWRKVWGMALRGGEKRLL